MELIARIEKALEGPTVPEADLERLARMDGSPFNGWYHYHAEVKRGRREPVGAEAALRDGGPAALAAYNQIMR